MNKPMNNWNETPLLRAGANVINTPVKTTSVEPCSAGFMPRYNVGNIHEIKKIWGVPAQG
ncbi:MULTISPECIES: hypothetical protein [Pseudomonas]|jgi:hypothetical protein|uniref:Uncharacterized protein n=2 Tax=Pseudomonas TaxID=286 RepID=A0A502HV21_9PSED|nr:MULTISPECIES: hypothetical protein [Pseudomonas]MBK5396527.1 hypothetical protein [Pseudomonas sp. TH39(2020)]RON36217.1 hypothetical protein BK664_19925 [Pseudomonas brassicacearum]TPG77765.1 hypothetical protein EAH74_25950 [Pseudomonas mandelii]TPG92434.1 hypothetical protein EAH72_22820 [Pseudomonas caspiana]